MKTLPLALAASLTFCIASHQLNAAVTLDPNLRITISHTNQNVLLTWFGSNSVPYQVESSPAFVWTNFSTVITGTGGFLSFTSPVSPQSHAFYRVKMFVPNTGVSADFNAGNGVLTITGDDLGNVIRISRDAAGVILVNNGAVPVTGGIATITNTVLIEAFGRDGNDQLTIDEAGGVLPVAHLFGEEGDDTLTGGAGADDLVGGSGLDTLIGRRGNDRLLGEADSDTFVWAPGDGSDLIEGGTGEDRLQFDGSNIGEIIELSANGARLRFTRNVGSITLDVDGVERVDFNALGGADNMIVNNLAGTVVTQVNLNLAGLLGGATGDAQPDVVTLNGTATNDTFHITANAGAVEASGLGALVRVVNGELANDAISITGVGNDIVHIDGSDAADTMTVAANGTNAQAIATGFTCPVNVNSSLTLAINGLGGPDMISCVGNLAALVPLVLDGGAGNDTILGSNGIDLLQGGDGNDFIDGQQGNDVVLGGADDDTFQWDPGDGSDTLEGQAGTDTLLFNGSGAGETFDLSANGARVLLTRNIGVIAMDLDDVEQLEVNTLGGNDLFTVNDLSGTDLTSVRVDLASTLGGSGGDALADTVIVNGTSGDDILTATLPGGQLLVSGLGASVLVEHFEPLLDVVRLQGLDGHDVLDASAVGAGGPLLVLDGGLGDDILLGGVGDDTLLGGDQDDVLLGGGGINTLDGGLGDNILLAGGNNVTNGIVSIFGDNAANTITISRDGLGNILTNGEPVAGASITNTALIRVFGLGGDDVITLSEANGALPAALLLGGAGVDTLTGGSGGDLLFGGSDNDTLLGKGGLDLLFGGAGNDTLTGGDGDDQDFGGADNDRLVWNPGDDTDLNEGGSGMDTVEVNGGNGAEQFTTTANGTRVRFDRLNPAPFALDIGTCESLVLNANGGDDSFSATGNLAALIQITVDGGAGNDTILGSNGIDLLQGGDGNDFIDGQQGNDVVLGGADDDTFQWDPGDGSDTLEGQAGTDTLLFNGSGIGEIIELSANGARLRFTRNVGTITLDVDGVERVDFNALGGADNMIVNNLSGTVVTQVNFNLAGLLGGATGDAQPDVVTLNGTATNDTFHIAANAGAVEASGLGALVRVVNGELTNDAISITGVGNDIVNIDGTDAADTMTVAANGTNAQASATGFTIPVNVRSNLVLALNGLGGPDLISCVGNLAALVPIRLDGGDGNDTLIGANGADMLVGGAGDDIIDGNQGNDVAFGGDDNDTFIWDPGDGVDLLEGQAGADVLLFNGSNIGEIIELSANGARLRFTRNIGTITLDVDGVERVDFNALGGADNMIVNNLAGTAVTQVNLNLAAGGGTTGDAQPDVVTLNGTADADTINIVANAGAVEVSGLSAFLRITHSEMANDQLIVNGLAGTDTITTGAGVSSLIIVTVNQD